MTSTSPATERSRQLISIQVLRAVAALGVLIAHFWPEFEQFGHPNPFPNFAAGGAGVDLFFVISGFIMVYTSESFFAQPGGSMQFMLRRLARIVPLYWAVSGAWLLFLLILRNGHIALEDLSWSSIAATFLFLPYPRPSGINVPVVGVGWTLNFEMFFYLCFAFAVALRRRRAVISVAALFGAIIAISHFVRPGPFNPLSFLADPIIFEFVYGMLIALAFRAGVRIPLGFTVALLTLSAGTFLYTVAYGFQPRWLMWGGAAACVVGALTLSAPVARPNLLLRGLAIVGDASYALYLTHTVDMAIPRFYIAPVVHPAHHPWIYAAILLVFCVGTAIAIHYLFERPVTRALHRLIGQATRSRAASHRDTNEIVASERVTGTVEDLVSLEASGPTHPAGLPPASHTSPPHQPV